jgi:2-keto-3-deoxy-L-rhamnonate aldolase RhmA
MSVGTRATMFSQEAVVARNRVKESAANGERVRGVHLTFAAPAVIEVLAAVDIHFVYLDGEHGSFDSRDIETACLAAERHGLTPIARVPDRSSATLTRFLDRGIKGIVAPHVENVSEARAVVDAIYFAPLGNRSFGGGRPEYGLRIGSRPAYMEACNASVALCLMIESQAGIDAAGDLAAIPGVDYLSFGLLDLAQSLGHPGNPEDPAVKAAVADASARIRAAGKRVREDFMQFVWINDLLVAGARQLFDKPR